MARRSLWKKNAKRINYMIDILANGINMCDVIDKVSLAKIDRDLPIKAGFFEDTSSLSFVDTINSVHRAGLGPETGP